MADKFNYYHSSGVWTDWFAWLHANYEYYPGVAIVSGGAALAGEYKNTFTPIHGRRRLGMGIIEKVV